MIKRIVSAIRNDGHPVDGVVQHAYNPERNDAIQFLVYVGGEISHIASTYRDPAAAERRLKRQCETVRGFYRLIDDDAIRRGVLFTDWVIDIPPTCFRIQEYKQRAFFFRPSHAGPKEVKTYLDLSSEWLLGFQRETAADNAADGSDRIRHRIQTVLETVRDRYPRHRDVAETLSRLTANLGVIKTVIQRSAHHGDYCHWNCFVDENGVFRVIDWEFASPAEWVVVDYLTNVLVLWMDLKRASALTGTLEALFVPRRDEEMLINETLMALKTHYGFTTEEIMIYLVYVFFVVYARNNRPVDEKYWLPFIGDVAPVLHHL